MTIMPGAGAYWFEGNEVGCLILHGFTGTPQNVRPLADYLARRGLTVSVPRIAGHGTTVQDLDATGPDDWLGTAEQALADAAGEHAPAPGSPGRTDGRHGRDVRLLQVRTPDPTGRPAAGRTLMAQERVP